jgi:hypothetical protein
MKKLHWLALRYETCPACSKGLTYLQMQKIYECRNGCGEFQISLNKFKEYVGKVFISKNDYAYKTKAKTTMQGYYKASQGECISKYAAKNLIALPY